MAIVIADDTECEPAMADERRFEVLRNSMSVASKNPEVLAEILPRVLVELEREIEP